MGEATQTRIPDRDGALHRPALTVARSEVIGERGAAIVGRIRAR